MPMLAISAQQHSSIMDQDAANDDLSLKFSHVYRIAGQGRSRPNCRLRSRILQEMIRE
jgi:hypothetical protein